MMPVSSVTAMTETPARPARAASIRAGQLVSALPGAPARTAWTESWFSVVSIAEMVRAK
jgi:hypothetical protein